MANNNDITDFLLKEYENVAQAFFNSYEIAAKWVRYYLIISAFPFSFVAIIYNNKTDPFDLFNLSNTIAVLLCLIGFLNVLVSYIIIDLRLDSVLYARTVNGVRKFFIEQKNDEQNNLKIMSEDFSNYVVLPADVNKPAFFKYHGDLFILTLFMGVVNSGYFTLGLMQIKQIKELNLPYCLQLLTFIIIIVLHIFIYKIAARNKELNYCKKKQ